MSIRLENVERVILRYHGGKWRLASRIAGLFPSHHTYVEPYGGAASVLMHKPRSHGEVYNDLDDQIVNVFRILRDHEASKELERLLRLTPYSRREFQSSYMDTDDPIERARRTILRSFQGFGSGAVTKAHKTGFRSNANRNGTTPARDWANYPDHIGSFRDRLQGVVIENREALDLIYQHDGRETLFYIDPPYPLGTRYKSAAWADCYRHELTDKDHRALAEVLHNVKGMVVLSGYRCDLYDRDLYPEWRSIELSGLADGGRKRIEVLWFNAAATKRGTQQPLFE
jgi:DNA adenine methylase